MIKPFNNNLIDDSQLFPIEKAFSEWREYYRQQKELIGTLIDKSQFHQKEYNSKYKNTDIEGRIFNSLVGFRMESEIYIPHSIRCAFLVQVFSFFEYQLNQICKVVGKQINQEPKKVYIGHSVDFLKQYFHIDLTTFSNWNFLNSTRLIRNEIVHSQGRIIKSDSPTIMNFIKARNSIVFFEFGATKQEAFLLIKEEQFIDEVLNNLETFFKRLVSQLR